MKLYKKSYRICKGYRSRGSPPEKEVTKVTLVTDTTYSSTSGYGLQNEKALKQVTHIVKVTMGPPPKKEVTKVTLVTGTTHI